MKQKQSFIEIKKNDYNNWQVEKKNVKIVNLQKKTLQMRISL